MGGVLCHCQMSQELEGDLMAGGSGASVVDRLAECRAVLGGERSGMRAVWDNEANDKQRRVLLAMAGRLGSSAHVALWASSSWVSLPEYLRSEIVCGMRRFRAWADGVGV